ncbi:leucine-rich repeat-containing protein 24 isoform X1 [Osmerus mordax]|uniref:leucine-rich repeat-containing protein 24 isoform X1 n=1 Tax=Osmerus mordax TaxID=8014 RepID=UPI0035106DD1
MAIKGFFYQWSLLLLCIWPIRDQLVEGCACPGATVLAQFPPELPTESCCLNYSGSSFNHVLWPTLSNGTNLQMLDLSHCNISRIEVGTTCAASPLMVVYLRHNRLTTLPGDFLATQTSLRVLDLGMNLLGELPEGFFKGSEELQDLDLQGNCLRSLPTSALQRSSLLKLNLADNPWDCSCSLVEILNAGGQGNSSSLEGNVTCASPKSLVGESVWSVRGSDVCRPPGLTALFILLPLLILLALVLCWCCGRTKKRKESLTFGSSKNKASHTDCNGHRQHRSKHPGRQVAKVEEGGGREEILKNQLLLRPSSTLLGSTRDIYEEVEIKLGSVDSLPRAPSHYSSSTEGGTGRQGAQGAGEGLEVGGKKELDAVSVTEVMKDSADREKAYLTQSTEYYSLVPGIDLEDSDHGEYESVDLS